MIRKDRSRVLTWPLWFAAGDSLSNTKKNVALTMVLMVFIEMAEGEASEASKISSAPRPRQVIAFETNQDSFSQSDWQWPRPVHILEALRRLREGVMGR